MRMGIKEAGSATVPASSQGQPRQKPATDAAWPRKRGLLPWLIILIVAIIAEIGPLNTAHWRTANLGAGTAIPLAQAQVGAGLTQTDSGDLTITAAPAATGSPGIDAPTTMAAASTASARASEAQAVIDFPLSGETDVRTITIGIDGPAPAGWRGNAITVQTRADDGQWRDISQQMWLDHTALGAPQRMFVYANGDATRRIMLHVPDTDAVRLVFLGPAGSPVRLSGITVNATMPFTFNPVRVLLMVAALALLWAFRPGSRLYAIAVGAGRGRDVAGNGRARGRDAKSDAADTRRGAWPRHLPSPAALAMTALVVVESAAFIAVAYASWRGGAYTGTFRSEALGHWVNRDEYPLLADALLHGRTWIDLPVDQRLTELPNPYDYSARRSLAEQGASMYWDYAYFNGRYYAYFGVLPALVLFAPFKALTGHDLPTPVAVMILGVAAIALMSALVLLIARRWFAGRVSLGMTLLLAAGVVIGSNVYYMARVPSFYSVPIVMSLALTVGALICWMLAKRGGLQGQPHAGWLATGSLLMACNMVSRPQFLAFAILGIPMFWNEIVHERSVLAVKGRGPLIATIATLLPFLVVGACLAAYNQARFGSPTDLGAAYNLTGYDMRNLRPSLSLLPAMLFIDWLQPVNLTASFPFVTTTDITIAAPTEPSLGGVLVQFPLGLLALGLWWVHASLRRHGDGVFGIACTFALVAVGVSIVDAAIGGVNNRYDCDFAWAPVLIAAIVAMCVDSADGRGIAPEGIADATSDAIAQAAPDAASPAIRAFHALVLALVMISVFICVFGWFSTGRLSPWISTNPNLYSSFAAWFGV